MEKLQDRIEKKLNDLQKRLDKVIDTYDLEQPMEKLFHGYSEFQLEDNLVSVQTLFTRTDVLLRMYRLQLRRLANELKLTEQHPTVQARQNDLLTRILKKRIHYVDRIGSNVMLAIRRELQVQSFVPSSALPAELNELFAQYFCEVLLNPKDSKSPVLVTLENLLKDVGTLTGCLTAAQTLIDSVHAARN